MNRAFTIVELIISIAVIFLLVTVAMVAFSSVKKSAERTATLNALKQMVGAYNAYHAEHKGRLMPGYIDPDDFEINGGPLNVTAKLQNGTDLAADAATAPDASAYVWRLAPYLDHAWKTFMVDYRSQSLESRLAGEFESGAYGPGTIDLTEEVGIARFPAFGLNSIFLGGDSFHGGSSLLGDPIPERAPWKAPVGDRIAATRLSEVKNPAKLIVFAPTKQVEVPDASDIFSEVTLGYVELRAPYLEYDASADDWVNSQWVIEAAVGPMRGQIVEGVDFSGPAGFPIDRLGGDKLPVGRLDGSVGTHLQAEFFDREDNAATRRHIMSFWSPFQVSTY